MNNRYLKEYQIKSPTPFRMTLPNKFPNRTEITINGFVRQNADRFHVNLVCGHNDEIALHFNPRFKDRAIVRNSFIGGDWGLEERTGGFNIEEKKDFTLTILCMEDKFKIFLNGIAYMFYNHRLSAELITDIEIDGQVNVHGILYESDNIILEPKDLIWKKLTKNLRKVETCPAGVTWGIDHKGVPTYFRKTADEGERWYVNSYSDDPKLKDLSLSVLDSPTNPENIALWAIDEKGKVLFREGVTIRSVAGKKWTQIETDQLVRSVSCGGIKQVWCCGEKGTCFRRFGITDTNPMGEAWRFVKCQDVGSTFKEVAVGKWTVWVLDDKGELYVRREITPINPGGVFWRKVTNNGDNNKFKRIYVSDENVWAVTKKGVLCKRMGISSSNPAGISWSYGLSANWYQISE